MICWLKKIFKNENIQTTTSPETIVDEMFQKTSNLDVISIKLGNDLLTFADSILDVIMNKRHEIFDKTGFVFPLVHVIDDPNLQENEFIVEIFDQKVYNLFVIPTEDDILNNISAAIEYIYNNHLDKIFTNEIFEKYLESVREKNSWLVWSVTSVIPIPTIKSILLQLLNSGKSIKNQPYIFETIGNIVLVNGYNRYDKYTSNEILNTLINKL